MRDAGIDVGIAAEDATMLPSYDFVIPDDDVIEVGDLRLRTIHTPGHTPGSTCFLLEGHPIVFSGDTLFPGGPGNTSFENAELRHDHRVDRPPAVHAARRHARAPRSRPRHHDRERITPPRRVDRARLVARCSRPSSTPCRATATTSTSRPSARPTRRSSCSGTARAATTRSGTSKCRCSPATTTSSRGTSAASACRPTAAASRTRAPRPPTCSRSSTISASPARTSSVSRSAAGPRSGSRRARRPCPQPRARRHHRRHRDPGVVEGHGAVAARRPVQPPRARRPFCRDHPERAHLYLQIGGLKREANPDQLAVLRGLRDVTYGDDDLAGHEVPTLFIVGSEDEIFSPATIADAAARVPGARVERIGAPATRPTSSSPRRGTPWSSTSGRVRADTVRCLAPCLPGRPEQLSQPGRILRGTSGVRLRIEHLGSRRPDSGPGSRGDLNDLRRGVASSDP